MKISDKKVWKDVKVLFVKRHQAVKLKKYFHRSKNQYRWYLRMRNVILMKNKSPDANIFIHLHITYTGMFYIKDL